MKIQNRDRINQILHDPEVYYFYYREKYNATYKTIKMLQEKNATPEFLTHLKVVLGEMCGKCAISVGALEHCNETILLKFWIRIEQAKDNISNAEDLEKFNELILQVEKTCLDMAAEKVSNEELDEFINKKDVFIPYEQELETG